MNNQKIILESLAMDLKRVALGLQRGAMGMARRFTKEALRRKKEVDTITVDPYMRRLLGRIEKEIRAMKSERLAEDILMYSTLVQNYAQKKL